MSSATLNWMRHNGIPITRDNWIALNYLEVPTEWTAEMEAEVPEELKAEVLREDGALDEALTPVNAAGIMYTMPDGKALFLKRSKGDFQGYWALPGGGINPRETPGWCRREGIG